MSTRALTRRTTREVLEPLLRNGGFCVNLSVDVSSLEVMRLCREHGALYIDTVNEPWAGFYFDLSLAPALRSNYACERRCGRRRAPTRRADGGELLRGEPRHGLVAAQGGAAAPRRGPGDPGGGARGPDRLGAADAGAGVKGVHIAERDTQAGREAKPVGTFVNTWSVDGFISESFQPAELGWGTHERWFPPNGAATRRAARPRSTSTRRGCSPRSTPGRPPRGRSTASWSRTTRRSPSRTTSPSARARRPSSARPATTPTTPATRRCSACTRRWARGGCRRR
jgi:hypothetical protein